MAVITFTEDVTLENEPEGTGPHYRKGYAPDVSDKEAQKWVGKGVAVFGIVDAPAEPVAAPAAPEPVAEETPKPRRRGKNWHPLDDDAKD